MNTNAHKQYKQKYNLKIMSPFPQMTNHEFTYLLKLFLENFQKVNDLIQVRMTHIDVTMSINGVGWKQRMKNYRQEHEHVRGFCERAGDRIKD